MAKCPAVGCASVAKPGMFLCWPHWRGLPKVIRDEVFRTWRADELLAHAEVCDEALRLIAVKEGREPPAEADKRAARMRRLLTPDASPNAGRITELGPRTFRAMAETRAPEKCADCGKAQRPGEPFFACDRTDGWRCEICAAKTPCYTEPHEEGCETVMWSTDA